MIVFVAGYRYELYCVTKSAQTPHCLVNILYIDITLILCFFIICDLPYQILFSVVVAYASQMTQSITSSFFNTITFHLAVRCRTFQKINLESLKLKFQTVAEKTAKNFMGLLYFAAPGRLNVGTGAHWVVSITPRTGGDWLHIARCLSGNDLLDSTHVWVDQSQERELLGRQ